MAVLSDADRKAIWREYMADASAEHRPIPVNKVDGRAVIDAIDAWAEANAASFNPALPQPGRGAFSAREKADLFCRVIRRRWEVS